MISSLTYSQSESASVQEIHALGGHPWDSPSHGDFSTVGDVLQSLQWEMPGPVWFRLSAWQAVLVREKPRRPLTVMWWMMEDRHQSPQHQCPGTKWEKTCLTDSRGRLPLWLLTPTSLGCPKCYALQLLWPLWPQQGWGGGKLSWKGGLQRAAMQGGRVITARMKQHQTAFL